MTKYVATNLADLHVEPSFLSELLTQVTNGVALEVLEERDKWCRVRQADGYEGWAYTSYLTGAKPPLATHLLCATVPALDAAETGRVVTRHVIGTALRVEETRGRWSRVGGAWIDNAGLIERSRLPLAAESAREQIVSVARTLTGTYYLWGGCTDWGIDCSGLAQLSYRLAGYEIPRDARLQFPATRRVDPPFQAGDLLFFAGNADDPKRITHVGISTGPGWNIVHSSRGRNGVYEEDAQSSESLRRTFAGAGTFLPES